jgi:sugar phosphate isomerase/epimerase
MTDTINHQDIRIGTLVPGSPNTATYIEQILPHGFESFSITFWETLGDTDLAKLAEDVMPLVTKNHAVISSLGAFGNPLEYDEKAELTRQAWRSSILHAHDFGCDIVAGFTGRLRGKAIHECLERYKEVFEPLAALAADKGVRLAFENCDMGGTWQSGDWNIAHNPAAWELMFETLPADNMGLEWEPCHQMVSLIDPMPQLDDWMDKIFHVHGKDATIHWDRIKKYGIHSSVHEDIALPSMEQAVKPFVYHRTPGFGDSNWTDIISQLRAGGFKGSIDIEGWHDPVYKEDLEMTGQVHSLNYLKKCRGGDYIPNPTS